MTDSFSRRNFLGAALCGAVSACGGNVGFDPTSGPVPDGQITSAIGQIDKMAADLMARTGIPGMAVAVVRQTPNGIQPVYAKGYGNRSAGIAGAVDADTVFQLASMSKSVGATVVAHQVGLGGISWDTPVQRDLPWFSLSDPTISAQLTVGDLYAHRSGLPGQAGDALEGVGFDQLEVLEKLRLLPLDPAPFRTKYAYSNFGLTAGAIAVVAAVAVTDPAKLPEQWASLCDRVLYQPLGMTRTSSRFDDFNTRSNRAFGHVLKNGTWVRSEVRQPDAQSPAGGVSSSVNDLALWLTMLIGKGVFGSQRVVGGAALATALTPQIQSRPASGGQPAGYYGYGFAIGSTASGRLTYAHSGAFTLGASTSFMVVPSTGVGIVVLTNAFPLGVPETLIGQFFDIVEYGSIQRDWWTLTSANFAGLGEPSGSLAGVARPTPVNPPQALSVYTGTYKNDYYDLLQVTQSGGALVLTVGPKAVPMPLQPWDGDLFAFTPTEDGVNPDSRYLVTFAGNQVTLEQLDGLNVFTRTP